MSKGAVTVLFVLLFASALAAQAIVDSVALPVTAVTGLAWDGTCLWASIPRRDSIFRVDPATGMIVSGIAFSIEDDYGGLAWDEDGSLWIANKDSIFKLDPQTGEVMEGHRAPGC